MFAESEFLLGTVQALVSKPELVSVREAAADKLLELILSVAPEDMGAVIGREGRTAGALRVLCRAIGAAKGRKVTLEIQEPKK